MSQGKLEKLDMKVMLNREPHVTLKNARKMRSVLLQFHELTSYLEHLYMYLQKRFYLRKRYFYFYEKTAFKNRSY